ncbi:MAG: hypothetical protein IJP00_02890 [Firmicutes bacterium]|nr:hypothetical protein [Bacillota bacterium]
MEMLKKIVCLCLFLLMIMTLSACNESEGKEEEQTQNIIETKYYTMTVPDSWEGKYYVEISDEDVSPDTEYVVTVYEKGSHDRFDAGHLFNIVITADEKYEAFAVGKKIGEITIDQKYYLFARYPSDVQFDDEGQEIYMAMEKNVEGVIYSIKAKDDNVIIELK